MRPASTWLVTGGSGFLGRHVLGALGNPAAADREVHALGRTCPKGWPPDRFVHADLNEPDQLRDAIRTNAPDVVIHTAGRTPPATTEELERANVGATVHLLDALRALGRPVRVVLVGSAAELGPVPIEELPVGEDYPCRPANAYGRSKLRATRAGLEQRPPLEVIVARVFNPVGPGLPESQAFGRFAAQLAGPGADPIQLVVGDLDARRDFIDARDVARALIDLAVRGEPGNVYHVGTGRSRRIGDGLRHLIALSGLEVIVEVDPSLAARPGPADSRADIRRIGERTGWRPEFELEQSLADLWADVSGPRS